jgi:hypothetical protein
MADTTIELAHRVRIDTDHRVYGLGCRAACSCGWAGPWSDQSADTALRSGTEHVDTAIGPPDVMDELMSTMLDLQDDLAEVVMWLAENWSSDLPIPAIDTRTHYDRVGRLLAEACLLTAANDPEALARAAERLGVPVVTDPGPVGGGNRYQRATRSFGRVEVQIIRRVEDAP